MCPRNNPAGAGRKLFPAAGAAGSDLIERRTKQQGVLAACRGTWRNQVNESVRSPTGAGVKEILHGRTAGNHPGHGAGKEPRGS